MDTCPAIEWGMQEKTELPLSAVRQALSEGFTRLIVEAPEGPAVIFGVVVADELRDAFAAVVGC